jgi:hypothetical protein
MKLRLPSPSLVISCLALAVALGGTSYAVTRLPASSVGPQQLKAKAVTRAKLNDDAIVGAKVARDAIRGTDIAESSLGTVPSALRAGDALRAAQADHAAAADHAATGAGLDQVNYRTAVGAVGSAAAATDTVAGTSTTATATARCDVGQHVTGGGVQVEEDSGLVIGDDFPSSSTTWTGRVENGDTASHTFTVYAICVPSGTAG